MAAGRSGLPGPGRPGWSGPRRPPRVSALLRLHSTARLPQGGCHQPVHARVGPSCWLPGQVRGPCTGGQRGGSLLPRPSSALGASLGFCPWEPAPWSPPGALCPLQSVPGFTLPLPSRGVSHMQKALETQRLDLWVLPPALV